MLRDMGNDVRKLRRAFRDALVIAAGCAVVAGLAGCAQAGIPALEAPAGTLPSSLQHGRGYEPSTARRVGSTADADFYVARQADGSASGVCLIVYPPDRPDQWVSGCGDADRFTVSSAGGAIQAEFIRHGVAKEDIRPGWKRVSDNVVAKP